MAENESVETKTKAELKNRKDIARIEPIISFGIERSQTLADAWNLFKITSNNGNSFSKELLHANDTRSQCRGLLKRIAERL